MRGMELFLVGGYVRDQLLGVASSSKDKLFGLKKRTLVVLSVKNPI
jgi:tRNA nucleotidyltransferase/poly(A) polymerase